MTSFIKLSLPSLHSGVVRAEAAADTARGRFKNFDSAKGLSVALLAAVVSALVVAADQLVDTWSDGHLLAAWVAVWAVGFVILALFAGAIRRLVQRAKAGLDAWSARQARARADQHLWQTALSDPRIMADLQTAMARSAAAKAAVPAEQPARLGASLLKAFDRLDVRAYQAASFYTAGQL